MRVVCGRFFTVRISGLLGALSAVVETYNRLLTRVAANVHSIHHQYQGSFHSVRRVPVIPHFAINSVSFYLIDNLLYAAVVVEFSGKIKQREKKKKTQSNSEEQEEKGKPNPRRSFSP